MNKDFIALKLGFEDWKELKITFNPFNDGTDEEVFFEEVCARLPDNSDERNREIANFILEEVTKED